VSPRTQKIISHGIFHLTIFQNFRCDRLNSAVNYNNRTDDRYIFFCDLFFFRLHQPVYCIVYAGHNEPTVTAVSIEMSGVLLIVVVILKVEHFTPLTLYTR
jgi:hypothetical protein